MHYVKYVITIPYQTRKVTNYFILQKSTTLQHWRIEGGQGDLAPLPPPPLKLVKV